MDGPTDTHGLRSAAGRVAEHVFVGVGPEIAGTVYGTIVAMATLTAAYANEKEPWKLAAIVASASFVLWLAHIYAHGLSASIDRRRRLHKPELAGILRHELGILLAAVAPTTVLVLGAWGLLHETAAVWLALAVGLVILGAEGVRFARLEQLGTFGTIAAVGVNLALGSLVVALKVELAH
jgi:hypothetical protein